MTHRAAATALSGAHKRVHRHPAATDEGHRQGHRDTYPAHQLAILQRQTGKPRLTWADRALLAALLRRLPRPRLRRLQPIVSPDTVLRWHRDFIRRRHAARSRRNDPAGRRPAAPSSPSSCAWRERTPAGATAASTASSPHHARHHNRCLHGVGEFQAARDQTRSPTGPPDLGRLPLCTRYSAIRRLWCRAHRPRFAPAPTSRNPRPR